jgi:hypothetical protein
MKQIVFNAGGNYVAAMFFGALPLLVLLVPLLGVRRETSRAYRFNRRLYHLPVLGLLAAYYAVIYWWLFYDQFYAVVAERPGTWELQYRVPDRSTEIDVERIADVRVSSGDLRTHEMARILIETADGEIYQSAQVSLARANEYLEAISLLRETETGAE